MRFRSLAFALAIVSATAFAEVKPLPSSQWPSTAVGAVPLIIAALTPAQRSIVISTSKENLFMLQAEWGEDIETLLGLNAGNTALVAATCAQPCRVNKATLLLMEAAWEALSK